MTADYKLIVYNLDNNRAHDQMAKEVRALLEGPAPHVLALCEAKGYDLPGVGGWRLVGRDTSKPGRANLACYVRNDVVVDKTKTKWHDCHEQWTRPNDPPNQHWPRSILELSADTMLIWVAHQPPKGTDNTKAAQQEGIDVLTDRMAPWWRDNWDDRDPEDQQRALNKSRVVLWDANRKPGETGPGPDMLCHNIDGYNCGQRIDLGTWRGEHVEGVSDAEYIGSANGVTLKSDHGHAFKFRMQVHD